MEQRWAIEVDGELAGLYPVELLAYGREPFTDVRWAAVVWRAAVLIPGEDRPEAMLAEFGAWVPASHTSEIPGFDYGDVPAGELPPFCGSPDVRLRPMPYWLGMMRTPNVPWPDGWKVWAPGPPWPPGKGP